MLAGHAGLSPVALLENFPVMPSFPSITIADVFLEYATSPIAGREMGGCQDSPASDERTSWTIGVAFRAGGLQKAISSVALAPVVGPMIIGLHQD